MWLIVFTICSLGVGLAGLLFPIHQDEGVFLRIANQMTKGYLPYGDYFDNKPPGIYFILLIFSSLFSDSLLAVRLMAFFANQMSAFFLFLLGRELFNKKMAIFSALTYLMLAPIYQGNFLLTETFMVLFILASALILVSFFKNQSLLTNFGMGLFMGIALVFKQTAIINLFIHLLFMLKVRKRNLLIGIIIYWLGALFPWVLLIIYFANHGILRQAFGQIFFYNILYYHPWPIYQTLLSLPKIIYPAIILWLMLGIGLTDRQKKLWPDKFFLVSTVALIPILLTRPYHHYWLQILPFAIILVFKWAQSNKIWSWLLRLNILFAGVIFIAYGFLAA